MRKRYIMCLSMVTLFVLTYSPAKQYANEGPVCEACASEEVEGQSDERLDESVPKSTSDPDQEVSVPSTSESEYPSLDESEAFSPPHPETTFESEEGHVESLEVGDPSSSVETGLSGEDASSEEAVSSESEEQALPTESIQSPGLPGVSLLSDINLTGAYEERVEMTLTGQGVLELNLLKDRFVIFQIPSALMPYLDVSSLAGSYEIPALVGVKRGTITADQWVVDESRDQIYFRANQLLHASVLSSKQYQFKLGFRLTRLPLGTPQAHTFYGHLTSELIRIDLLSNGRDAWTLETEGPVFQLDVPSAIDFGSVPIRPGDQLLHRDRPMQLTVSHLRARGYAWRLTASATPLTSSGGHTLTDTIFFKKKDGTIVSLEQGVQVIAEGAMTEQETLLTYESTEGIFLNVPSQLAQPTTYQSTINWTLVNAP